MSAMKGNMEKQYYKHGASVIIATIILIALTLVTLSVIWIVTSGFIKKGVSESSACFGVFEKITLDSKKTCYNQSSGELNFFISVGDVEIEGVTVGISSNSSGKSLKINNERRQRVENLLMYNRSQIIVLPGKNEGFEYIYNMPSAGFSEDEFPKMIQISPKIKGIQCEVSDSINQIETCGLNG